MPGGVEVEERAYGGVGIRKGRGKYCKRSHSRQALVQSLRLLPHVTLQLASLHEKVRIDSLQPAPHTPTYFIDMWPGACKELFNYPIEHL